MKTFFVEIITPLRRAYSADADSVCVPTAMGTTGVLAHHMPLFTSLTSGEVKIIQGNKEYLLVIGGGFMQVVGNHVSILVSRAVHADELNEAEIGKAQKEAKEALSRRIQGDAFIQAQSILRRSSLELKILRRHKSRRQSPAVS
ncbi:ATP synthase F1 subunit epsilon [Patescibacteria group bacterium]|nr:ATP synthase F1 subunit epsilon [Patescibacteria group bacterium]MBU1473009.1 ATP synthase F1 subunit epsilon [Patescibacteria group bacterium]MBU2460344.1 ATP synthase F1 subunit epsilon [Patescibacteria group bacterium]MBU2544629.1 ATP synthase F1 subunit epsilon [Patescibacteria group bacterium]